MLDRDHLGLLDVKAERNAFGRQLHSFEADLDDRGRRRCTRSSSARRGSPRRGDDVEVLAEVDGHPVAVRQGNMLAVSFHPELAGDERLHERFLERPRCYSTTSPWRTVFSVTTRGSTKCSR